MSETTELIAQQILNGNINKRTWGDILYNVKSYGATGNGTTDDTAAVQATIDYAVSVGGKAIFFPHGTYKVTSFTNLDQVVLFGDNASFLGITNKITQLGAPTSSSTSINVKDYGAKGDGVADDTTAIQAAANAMRFGYFSGGSLLYFPDGRYKVSLPIILPATAIGISASNINTYIFNSTTSTAAGAGDVFRIAAAGAGYGINFSIQNIQIIAGNKGACIKTTDPNNAYFNDFTAINCRFDGGGLGKGEYGVYLKDVVNPRFIGCTFVNARWGCLIIGSVEISLSNCNFQQNSRAGLEVDAETGNPSEGLYVDNCIFINNSTAATINGVILAEINGGVISSNMAGVFAIQTRQLLVSNLWADTFASAYETVNPTIPAIDLPSYQDAFFVQDTGNGNVQTIAFSNVFFSPQREKGSTAGREGVTVQSRGSNAVYFITPPDVNINYYKDVSFSSCHFVANENDLSQFVTFNAVHNISMNGCTFAPAKGVTPGSVDNAFTFDANCQNIKIVGSQIEYPYDFSSITTANSANINIVGNTPAKPFSCELTATVDTVINTDLQATISFSTDKYDPWDMHTSGAPDTVSIPVTGLYHVSARAKIADTSVNGTRTILIDSGAKAVSTIYKGQGVDMTLAIDDYIYYDKGDLVKVVIQNIGAGSNITVIGTTTNAVKLSVVLAQR